MVPLFFNVVSQTSTVRRSFRFRFERFVGRVPTNAHGHISVANAVVPPYTFQYCPPMTSVRLARCAAA